MTLANCPRYYSFLFKIAEIHMLMLSTVLPYYHNFWKCNLELSLKFPTNI